MKLSNKLYITLTIAIAIISLSSAQVSISTGTPTTNPKGVIDMQNSTAGLVYPRFSLTATNVQAPVENPNGSATLEPGTVVYNMNSTATGTNDVYPGIYAWDGTEWTTQFIKEDSNISEQASLGFRVVNSDSYVDVPGLGAGSSFTPKYSGTYRVKANFNFGAGKIVPDFSFVTSMATQEGYFRITLDGDVYLIYTHSYSVYNQDINEYFEQFRHDSSLIVYVDLVAGVQFDYQFEIDLFVSSNFENGGNSGDGRPYVGIGLPCTIEFTYLEGQ